MPEKSTKTNQTKTISPQTMEELLALNGSKPLKLVRDQEVKGKVILKNDQEIVVDLGTKSEGIIPIRNTPPDLVKNIKIGDEVTVFVTEEENEVGQVVLSLQRLRQTGTTRGGKQPIDEHVEVELWKKLTEKYSKEEIVKGEVSKITQFGVFVRLEEGIEGLIHSSKLGSDDHFEIGQAVSVMVDSIDAEKRRISLTPVLTSTKGLIYK